MQFNEDRLVFTTEDLVTIRGKMVVGRLTLSSLDMVKYSDQTDILKQTLVRQMVEYIINNKLVEFTKQEDPVTLQTRIAVRAYLAPDDQVKLLRTWMQK
jgi:hypothetical protein